MKSRAQTTLEEAEDLVAYLERHLEIAKICRSKALALVMAEKRESSILVPTGPEVEWVVSGR